MWRPGRAVVPAIAAAVEPTELGGYVLEPATGPEASLPLSDEMLRAWPSGNLFGLTQGAAMGWKPEDLLDPQYLILSTQGGVRQPDGRVRGAFGGVGGACPVHSS